MKISIGILLLTLPYSYKRGKVIYYQRAIPADLQERCAAKRVKIKLDATNIRLAAKQIETINRMVEIEWKVMRSSPSAVPKTIKALAGDLLNQWGLTEDAALNDEFALSLFYDHIDRKREHHSEGDEEVYRTADPAEYLKPHEIEAARVLAGRSKPRLTDALELYLKLHPKRNQETFCNYARRSFGRMVEAVGDKTVDEVSREDGHRFVSMMLEEGLATSSIRRLLNTDRAVMETYITEKQINRTNPFASIPIPDEGEDAKDAIPYTSQELKQLVAACKEADDEPRWLLALIADTGARLAEVAGLSLTDIKLDCTVPHMVLKVHPWRSLKNKASARTVPLLGASRWAAERVVANLSDGQTFAFPRYNKTKKTNANSASAALNKWIKGCLEQEHIVHELRHTIADRLREVQCPADVRLAIGGWTVKGEGENYGQGYSLKIMSEWMAKVVTPSTSE